MKLLPVPKPTIVIGTCFRVNSMRLCPSRVGPTAKSSMYLRLVQLLLLGKHPCVFSKLEQTPVFTLSMSTQIKVLLSEKFYSRHGEKIKKGMSSVKGNYNPMVQKRITQEKTSQN